MLRTYVSTRLGNLSEVFFEHFEIKSNKIDILRLKIEDSNSKFEFEDSSSNIEVRGHKFKDTSSNVKD